MKICKNCEHDESFHLTQTADPRPCFANNDHNDECLCEEFEELEEDE